MGPLRIEWPRIFGRDEKSRPSLYRESSDVPPESSHGNAALGWKALAVLFSCRSRAELSKCPSRSYPEVTCARPAFIEIIGVRPLTSIHHALGHYQDGPHFS